MNAQSPRYCLKNILRITEIRYGGGSARGHEVGVPWESRTRGGGGVALTRAHHAGAATIVAVLHLGARLIPSAITSLTGISDVHSELLVDTLGSLIECQIHDVLQKSRNGPLSFLK